MNVLTLATFVMVYMYVGRGHGYVSVFILFTIGVMTFAMLFEIFWFKRYMHTTADMETIRDAWLVERHCPACAYPIAEHTHRPDHLHCPECGATWANTPPATSA